MTETGGNATTLEKLQTGNPVDRGMFDGFFDNSSFDLCSVSKCSNTC